MITFILFYLVAGLFANFVITAFFIIRKEEEYGFRNPFHDESIGYILLWPVFILIVLVFLVWYLVRNTGGSVVRSVKRLWSK